MTGARQSPDQWRCLTMVIKPVVEWEGGFVKWLAGALLMPLSAMALLFFSIRNWMSLRTPARRGLYRATLIGIGSLSIGGSGKTPLAMWTCVMLCQRGLNVAYVSSGYGRRGRGLCLVSDGQTLKVDIRSAGDEAFMVAQEFISRGCRIPVVVDKIRERAVEYLCQNHSIDVVVLDDTFQYRRIRKDLNVLVQDTYEREYPAYGLPVGRLRDTWRALQEADIVIVSKRITHIPSRPPSRPGERHVIGCRYTPVQLQRLDTSEVRPMTDLSNRQIVAFAALGHHRAFRRTMENFLALYNSRLIRYIEFQDHHWYSQRDITRLVRLARPGQILLTTPKDAVKLLPAWINKYAERFYVIRSEIEFLPETENEVVEKMMQAIKRKPGIEPGGTT